MSSCLPALVYRGPGGALILPLAALRVLPLSLRVVSMIGGVLLSLGCFPGQSQGETLILVGPCVGPYPGISQRP